MSNPLNNSILIVNDDTLTLSAEINLLSDAGYEVFSANNGAAALEIVGQRRPGLILVEIALPDMPGIELCRRVRSDVRNTDTYIALLSGSPISGDQQALGYQDGANAYIVRPISAADLLARIQIFQQIRASEHVQREFAQRFKLLADSAPILIWSSGADGKRDYFNRAWLQFTGRSQTEQLNDGWLKALHPQDRSRCQAAFQAAVNVQSAYKLEYRLLAADGDYGWFLESAVPRLTEAGEFQGMLGSCLDLTENRRLKQQLTQLKESPVKAPVPLLVSKVGGFETGSLDALTGVYNHRCLRDMTQHQLAIARRYHHPLAVIHFDLDHFKKINEVFGRQVGDDILKRVAETVRAEIRGSDIMGRGSEDDFVIIQPVTSASNACVLAERIRAAVTSLSIPVQVDDATNLLSISIGIDEMIQTELDSQPESLISRFTDSVDYLFQRAEQAMQSAKIAGRNTSMLHQRLR